MLEVERVGGGPRGCSRVREKEEGGAGREQGKSHRALWAFTSCFPPPPRGGSPEGLRAEEGGS